MTYKTLGGGLDLSLSMESKSNSLPLMMSAGGAFRRDLQGILGEHLRASRGKKTAKRRQISPFGVRNPVFCGGKTLRCYFRIYGGDFLWSGYISESYASFCLFFTLLRILAPGTLKTRVNRCFCSSNVSVSAMLVSMRQKNIAQVSILERYFFVSTYQAAGPDTCLAVFVVASLPLCLWYLIYI